MKKFSITFICLFVALNMASIKIEASEEKDTTPPKITVTNDDIYVMVGSNFELKDYIEVEDEGNYHVSSIGKYDINKAGKYSIDVFAVDDSGNTSTVKINFRVVSKADYLKLEDDHLKKEALTEATLNVVAAPSVRNDYLALAKGDGTQTDAYTLALSFIGMGGYCNEVAQAFVNAYFGPGHSIGNYYVVSAAEALPGDVLFYADGGIGTQHWAVYLGGDSALQGNYLGTTIIGSVYLNNASDPLFLRLY